MVTILKEQHGCFVTVYVMYVCTCESICAPVCKSTSAHMFCTESPRLIVALSWSLMGCGENSSTSPLCKI